MSWTNSRAGYSPAQASSSVRRSMGAWSCSCYSIQPPLEFDDPSLQKRDLSRLRLHQRKKLFPTRLDRRFENHPILESKFDSAVQKILTPHNLGCYVCSLCCVSSIRAREACDAGGYKAGRSGERRGRCRLLLAPLAAFRLHLQPGGSGVHPCGERGKLRTGGWPKPQRSSTACAADEPKTHGVRPPGSGAELPQARRPELAKSSPAWCEERVSGLAETSAKPLV